MSDDDAAFKICIHYAGHVRRDVSRYVGGETCDLGVNDIDKLCYFDIIDKLNEVRIQSVKALYYKVLDLPFASGLLPLNGSDVDDDELVAGIEKMNHRYADFESFNCAASKAIEKGKQKVIEVSKGKKNLNPFSNSIDANQASKGIVIRDVEGEGPRFVANSNLENSDSDFSDRDSEYVDSSDPSSYYSDSSIEDLDSFVKDDALRTAKFRTHKAANKMDNLSLKRLSHTRIFQLKPKLQLGKRPAASCWESSRVYPKIGGTRVIKVNPWQFKAREGRIRAISYQKTKPIRPHKARAAGGEEAEQGKSGFSSRGGKISGF
ncbi:hypothetical protein SLEP1_g25634 [Rubroshorea leprosula]|uniref:PB1-like domain-containing protein n=1 Tax=Rubroshorea leprosula TaxID=152421 RepID=A0AAV5JVT0_9ROSI|nr:hypothetical protein SLEP1_g25634 [Rubroshorea leprosula]